MEVVAARPLKSESAIGNQQKMARVTYFSKISNLSVHSGYEKIPLNQGSIRVTFRILTNNSRGRVKPNSWSKISNSEMVRKSKKPKKDSKISCSLSYEFWPSVVKSLGCKVWIFLKRIKFEREANFNLRSQSNPKLGSQNQNLTMTC